jgi:GT2 family glycosyltransferase
MMPAVDILLPTYNRRDSLILTLAGVAAQTLTDLRVIVADQSDVPADESPVVRAVCAAIEVRGIAEQRDFLLHQATAPAVLYLFDSAPSQPRERQMAAGAAG